MKLSNLLSEFDCKRVIGSTETEIKALAYDSRRVKRGALFFAIRGFRDDGHNYIGQAIKNGAVGLVVEKYQANVPEAVTQVITPDSRSALAMASACFYDYPSSRLRLIGVTGTNGKTTTSFLIERIFRAAGKKTGLIGTIDYRIGDRVLAAERTTPESLDLQALLASMADAGVEIAVMEVSSHASQLKRIDGCRFETAVFTNLTQDHLDFHRDMDEYFQAKARLFTDNQFSESIKVINIDNEFGEKIWRSGPDRCVTYGFSKSAEIRGESLRHETDGLNLIVSSSSKELELSSKIRGIFNGANILAATAVAWSMNVPDKAVKEALSEPISVPGRFESIDLGQDFQVIVDYAHTPDGLRRVLEAARVAAAGNLITVFGCGGDRDKSKRPLMGRVAAELSDRVFVTSDNPRNEPPEKIIKEITVGMRNGKMGYRVVVDRYQAIKEAIRSAGKGDLVLIAGKGHETGQIFADRIIPFDDRLVALGILKEVVNDTSKSD